MSDDTPQLVNYTSPFVRLHRPSELAILAIVFILALLLSCDAPESIAKFCSSAVVTLRSGDALFDDMMASCVREAQTRESFGTFPISSASPASCKNIGGQAEGLKAGSKILVDYFTALNDLASFGTTKAGADASDLLTKVSTQANLSPGPQMALASVAGFLTQSATSGYQRKQLATEIVKVHEDIKIALDGLGEAAGVVYLHQLQDEEQKTATRYQEFLLSSQGAASVLLALDSRWQGDRASFDAKQKAAVSYKTALDTVAKGNEDLAAHVRDLKAKELPGLLSPYSATLESLAPAIQKAFF